MKLEDIINGFSECGEVQIRIDRANPNLIAEAVVMGAHHRSWEDSQCVGRFHHYTLKSGRVEVELITTRPVDIDEIRQATYLGLSVEAYRKDKAKRL